MRERVWYNVAAVTALASPPSKLGGILLAINVEIFRQAHAGLALIFSHAFRRAAKQSLTLRGQNATSYVLQRTQAARC